MKDNEVGALVYVAIEKQFMYRHGLASWKFEHSVSAPEQCRVPSFRSTPAM